MPTPGEFDAETSAHLAKASERFVFQKLLGKGASGAVYQAYDRSTAATIAVKFLTALDPGSLFRFKSEFRTLANIVDRNLLQLYELLAYDDAWLLTMEFVDGTDFLSFVRPPITSDSQPTLADDNEDDQDTGDLLEDANPTAITVLETSENTYPTMVRNSLSELGSMAETLRPPGSVSTTIETQLWPFDESRMRAAFLQLCRGISALHRAGRLHRDLKPANVLVASADARVVICDSVSRSKVPICPAVHGRKTPRRTRASRSVGASWLARCLSCRRNKRVPRS